MSSRSAATMVVNPPFRGFVSSTFSCTANRTKKFRFIKSLQYNQLRDEKCIKAKKIKTYKLGDYPECPIITYKEIKNNITQRTFNYFIEAEGFYPKISELSTWGRGKNQQTVQCKIKYKNGNPEFQILFVSDFEHVIKSNKSASKIATDYNKA
ncbi:20233_t:CDS:2, partial [Funneliformis geosporum]